MHMQRAFCITEIARENSLFGSRQAAELPRALVFSFPRQLTVKQAPGTSGGAASPGLPLKQSGPRPPSLPPAA